MLLAAVFSMMLFAPVPPERVEVRMITDEPEAVLAILAKRAAGSEVTAADWQKLFESEGYRRLKKREAAMQRAFTDEEFKRFVLSPELLARKEKLQETLEDWKQADVSNPGALALAYLPEDAQIHAKVYPSIKPKENSFVFEVDTDPAIFLYLDPEVNRAEFENTLAHELHHIGFGTACPPKAMQADTAKQPAPVQTVRKWVSAFGEGFAMLAAAGGPDAHPRATASQEKHERWDMDMAHFYQDRLTLDDFFMKILKGELSGEKADQQAFTYFGYQGPWYTVGYRMDVVIEKAFGRQRLINAMCDGSVLAAYNEAFSQQANPRSQPAGKPAWSPEIVKATQVATPEK
jgi:Putative zinc dependent peptidase (DUF5700)